MDGEPPQEEDFSQIPLVERSTHKNWKARLSAYTDVIAKSAKTASDTDPFFQPFVSDGALLKKWCLDANAVAQEKGIEAVLAIATHSGETSARLRPEVVPALVEKALGNTRAGTRKKGIDLCAMFVEVENGGEGVVGDVLVGLNAKQPKAVAGAATCLKEIVESFGVSGLGDVKLLLKAIPKIFAHSDKNVRAEGTSLTLALYTYLGPALLPALADLKPVQMTDLQKSFDALDAEGKGARTGKPARFTRAAQRERETAEDAGGADGDDGGTPEEEEAIDPLQLLDPVNVFDLFPSDVMERLGSTKWKERLEACEECNKVLAQPQNARVSTDNVDDYATLVTTLGTKCHKDANVNVVMEAAKLLEGLAHGIGKPFGRFRNVTMTGCLERLKERKATVVEALGKALDAIFLTTTLADIHEDVMTALKSKNPQVKEGTLNFLHRSLKMTQDAPAKDNVKPMAEALVTLLSDGLEPVRTAAAECLGTMMKILGERAFNPYVENVPEIQMAKVKDAFGRAEIRYKTGGAKAAARAPAPAAKAAPAARAPVKKSVPPSSPPIKASGKFDNDLLMDEFAPPARAPPARFQRLAKTATGSATSSGASTPAPSSPTKPRAAPPSRPPVAKPPAAKPPAAKPPPAPVAKAAPPAKSGGGGAKTLAVSPSEPIKYRYTPEDAAARAEESIPADYHTKLADAAWKVRLEAADEMITWVSDGEGADVDSEVMMRFLGKTPGWGEKNFQVSAKLFQVMGLMAEKSATFGKPAAGLIIGPLTDKLGDMKLKKPAGDALTVTAEKTSLAFVLAQSYEPMTKQKAPKAQADALTWIKQQIIDFGIAGIPLRELIGFVKAALGSPNAMVRSSATALLVQIKVFVGADISGFIEDLNPQLLTTINKEFEKAASQTPPEPTRQQADLKEVAAGPGGKGAKGGADPLDDLIPRVDLDKLVASTSVIADHKSDAWKVRKEAYEALNTVLDIKSNSRLKPNMGEIGSALKKAMADTNLSVKMTALGIISKIATGMGPPFDKHTRLIVAPVASVCADQKATTRTAAVNTLTAMADAIGSVDSFYVGLATSLESTNPALRASVLGWLAARLAAEPPSPHADMSPMAAPVITCLEDRNGDVRKAATAVLPFVVARAGYDFVMEQTSNLKPASKATILPLINNARSSVAAEPDAPAPAPAARAAPTPAAARIAKAPGIKPPGTPRAAPAAVAKASIPAPRARSIAMNALGSAPSTRPTSTHSDDRGGGLPVKSRLAVPRSGSAATSGASHGSSPSGRTIPFTSTAPDSRHMRLKRDATRWNLEASARNDTLDYLHQQMEPHTSPDIFTLLFSKDHKAEEDFMAALSVVAEFYDVDTWHTFGLPADEIQAIQLANVDLALKYAAIRLMSNNTQLGNRSLEVIANVLATHTRMGERLSDVEVKLFVPALVIKLGDAKFGPRLAPIFEGLDKLIPASVVVQLLVQYGLEDKTAGKTCKNESLQLIEKAYRKRGSVLRKDDRGFYEAVAKCIADPGTRQAALTLMALLQLQGESRSLQAIIDAMPTSSKDMLANRRATMQASKAGAAGGVARLAGEEPQSPRSGSPGPRAGGTPTQNRLSRDMAASPSSPTSTRPSSRGISTASSSRLPTGSHTPSRSITSALPRAGATALHPPPGSAIARKTMPRPAPVDLTGNGGIRPSMQPLGRMAAAAPAAPQQTEAQEAIDALKTPDIDDAAEALKMVTLMLEDDDAAFVPEARPLLDAICFQLERQTSRPEDLLEPRNLRRIKHLMRSIHIAYGRPNIVKRFKLANLERVFSGIRELYSLLEVWSEGSGDDVQPANDLRDYMSMVLSTIIATPSRELVYAMLFNSLISLCQDMTPNQDPRVGSEIGVVLQCTYKRVRSIDQDLRNNRIQAGTLLAVIEDLLQVIPPVQWRKRPKYGLPHGDLPLRVIKTLLQRVIVYTKEIGIGIYDLLQEQFGAEADVTTVYSYIFRISSAEEAPSSMPPPAAPEQPSELPTRRPSTNERRMSGMSGTDTKRRSNGYERPLSTVSSSSNRLSTGDAARPLSMASSGQRSSIGADLTPTLSKSPSREVSDAERLVRRLTDTRDNEQRLNELHAWMKLSPGNEVDARAAIASILNPAAQTFVWRALDRRNEDAEPKSPSGAASPVRSPMRELQSPPLGSIGGPSPRQSLAARPVSLYDAAANANLPMDERLAQLKNVFASRASGSNRSSPSATPRPQSEHLDSSTGSSGRPTLASMGRPLSEIESARPSLAMTQRPFSEIHRKSATPEID